VRVLVIEDEEVMADAITRGLRRAGFAVDFSLDGLSGYEKALDVHYDVIVLDRDLPRMHGDNVCAELVQNRPSSRILMLTASGAVSDRIGGLDLGADDYLAKPFVFGELVARTRALGRRSVPATSPILIVDRLEIDSSRRSARIDGVDLDLTTKEFGLLAALAQEPGRIVSAEELMQRVWDERLDPFSNVVRFTMVGLRRKVGHGIAIETVRGVGYRLRPSLVGVDES
jgi:DNA-binding response OmpR family regulator